MDKRLNSIISFVQQGDKVVDIGTDHGIIPVLLYTEQRSRRILATDISQASLQKLIDKIDQNRYTGIETLQSDGFKGVNVKEYDTFIISGMGGHLISNIINPVKDQFFPSSKLILQPNNASDGLRNFLIHNGFVIEAEDIQLENNKYYEILCARLGKVANPTQFNVQYGEKLIEKKSPILVCKLYRELRVLDSIRKNIIQKASDSSDLEKILSKENKIKEILKKL